MVDHVLPPEEMPAKLVEYAAYLRQSARVPAGYVQDAREQLGRICGLLRHRTGHDFSRYKDATVLRRIQRRMQVLQIPSVAGYVARLRDDGKEADQLFRDLLIGVTQFFRDPAAFDALARQVVPRIVANVGPEGRSGSGPPAAPPARRPTPWP
jgi:two-component system CheB/CheR fusion protein